MEGSIPQHNTFFFQEKENTVVFDSNFDSGNCNKVEKMDELQYNIWTAKDCEGTESEGYSKSWFYFSVSGFAINSTATFTLKTPGLYRPIYKINSQSWERLPNEINLIQINNDTDLIFSYTFTTSEKDKVYFSFSYPFSYQELQEMLEKLESKFKNDEEIYFQRDILAKSVKDRNIDLLTISSHEGKLSERENINDSNLFPEKDKSLLSFKFRETKSIVLLIARVHPGETPGSHAMNGAIEFLLNKYFNARCIGKTHDRCSCGDILFLK